MADDQEITAEEINEYARLLGIEPETEPHLLWIAKQGISAPLPPDWKPVESDTGELYFFNFKTGESCWEHPSDDTFRETVKHERKRAQAGDESEPLGKDGKKTTQQATSTLSGMKLAPLVKPPSPGKLAPLKPPPASKIARPVGSNPLGSTSSRKSSVASSKDDTKASQNQDTPPTNDHHRPKTSRGSFVKNSGEPKPVKNINESESRNSNDLFGSLNYETSIEEEVASLIGTSSDEDKNSGPVKMKTNGYGSNFSTTMKDQSKKHERIDDPCSNLTISSASRLGTGTELNKTPQETIKPMYSESIARASTSTSANIATYKATTPIISKDNADGTKYNSAQASNSLFKNTTTNYGNKTSESASLIKSQEKPNNLSKNTLTNGKQKYDLNFLLGSSQDSGDSEKAGKSDQDILDDLIGIDTDSSSGTNKPCGNESNGRPTVINFGMADKLSIQSSNPTAGLGNDKVVTEVASGGSGINENSAAKLQNGTLIFDPNNNPDVNNSGKRSSICSGTKNWVPNESRKSTDINVQNNNIARPKIGETSLSHNVNELDTTFPGEMARNAPHGGSEKVANWLSSEARSAIVSNDVKDIQDEVDSQISTNVSSGVLGEKVELDSSGISNKSIAIDSALRDFDSNIRHKTPVITTNGRRGSKSSGSSIEKNMLPQHILKHGIDQTKPYQIGPEMANRSQDSSSKTTVIDKTLEKVLNEPKSDSNNSKSEHRNISSTIQNKVDIKNGAVSNMYGRRSSEDSNKSKHSKSVNTGNNLENDNKPAITMYGGRLSSTSSTTTSKEQSLSKLPRKLPALGPIMTRGSLQSDTGISGLNLTGGNGNIVDMNNATTAVSTDSASQQHENKGIKGGVKLTTDTRMNITDAKALHSGSTRKSSDSEYQPPVTAINDSGGNSTKLNNQTSVGHRQSDQIRKTTGALSEPQILTYPDSESSSSIKVELFASKLKPAQKSLEPPTQQHFPTSSGSKMKQIEKKMSKSSTSSSSSTEAEVSGSAGSDQVTSKFVAPKRLKTPVENIHQTRKMPTTIDHQLPATNSSQHENDVIVSMRREIETLQAQLMHLTESVVTLEGERELIAAQLDAEKMSTYLHDNPQTVQRSDSRRRRSRDRRHRCNSRLSSDTQLNIDTAQIERFFGVETSKIVKVTQTYLENEKGKQNRRVHTQRTKEHSKAAHRTDTEEQATKIGQLSKNVERLETNLESITSLFANKCSVNLGDKQLVIEDVSPSPKTGTQFRTSYDRKNTENLWNPDMIYSSDITPVWPTWVTPATDEDMDEKLNSLKIWLNKFEAKHDV